MTTTQPTCDPRDIPHGVNSTVSVPMHPLTKREFMATEILSAIIRGHPPIRKDDEAVLILRALRMADKMIEALEK